MPEKNLVRDYSWKKINTSNFGYKRKSLESLYSSDYIVRPNRYNYRWH